MHAHTVLTPTERLSPSGHDQQTQIAAESSPGLGASDIPTASLPSSFGAPNFAVIDFKVSIELRPCLLRPPLKCTGPLPDCQSNPRPMLDGFRENLAPNATLDTLADALEAI